jgi:DNA mismatch repair protein MutS2
MQDLELYLGSMSFHDLALSRGLAVCLPELVPPPSEEDHSERDLRGLFNPLLLADRGVPKPCDIKSPRHDAIVLVTGPNSGGKTRLLQAIAIAHSRIYGRAISSSSTSSARGRTRRRPRRSSSSCSSS